MIRAALNASAPIFLAASIPPGGGGSLFGIGAAPLGFALLMIMALMFIVNQGWTLFEKARNAIRKPESDTSDLVRVPICGTHRTSIGRTLDQLRKEDARQDALNKARFDTLDQSIQSMRGEMREDNKEVSNRLDTMTSAVGELIGRTSK